MKNIIVQGARTHNLKNISVEIPRDQFVVITGLSGSGKSSLAFDTLYAEGQRRYVESLSAYARQFLSLMEKPDVDHIEGLSPAISIEQKASSHNPRSTVGTVTEIYDYLRLLFARTGTPKCPEHQLPLTAQTIQEMVEQTFNIPEETKIMVLSPIIRNKKGEHTKLFEQIKREGFVRLRINNELYEIESLPKLDKNKKNTIEVVIDRFKVKKEQALRLSESLETALRLSDGLAIVANLDETNNSMLFSSKFACPECNHSITELEPKMFSFNSPSGACPTCDGLGRHHFFDPKKIIPDHTKSLENGAILGWTKDNQFYFDLIESLAAHFKFSLSTPFSKLTKALQDMLLYGSKEQIKFETSAGFGYAKKYKSSFEGIIHNFDRRYQNTDSDSVKDDLQKFISYKVCDKCQGKRLNESARNVFIQDVSLPEIVKFPIIKTLDHFKNLKIIGHKAAVTEKIAHEIIERLSFLVDVGLEYLTLDRSSDTLSGGESQRIRLASQIGAGLVGVLYILDEPSIGLHQRDNSRLLKSLMKLKELGNTVIVVEHDEDFIKHSDFIIDIGPGAGIHGGEIIFAGKVENLMTHPDSLTGKYLSKTLEIKVPKIKRQAKKGHSIILEGATGHNLHDVTLNIPLGLLTCITGVSGSGKSTLINHTLRPLAEHFLNKSQIFLPEIKYKKISGLEELDKVIAIDQAPIGRTPRSNPATYIGLFTTVRELFAMSPEARARGYKAGRFSFNVKGGRCEACQGDGFIKVAMHFLADMYVTCDQCHGKRYNKDTLDIHFKSKSIADVLALTVEEGLDFFASVPALYRKLQTLFDVGLGYIKLGQAATTLSGGEAQRIKLAKELSKKDTGKTLYLFDEPTTGLHFEDIRKLLEIIHKLTDKGNTVVIIEHNLDVIKTADWIIDLGPEGGDKGGKIIAQGTPETVAKEKKSFTGQYLKAML